MKKILLILSIVVMSFASCVTDNPVGVSAELPETV